MELYKKANIKYIEKFKSRAKDLKLRLRNKKLIKVSIFSSFLFVSQAILLSIYYFKLNKFFNLPEISKNKFISISI
jgi:Na+/melibiose symporter-like transporter